MIRDTRLLPASVFSVFALLLGASAAAAATITVTTIEDGSVPGECSLRDATLAANENVVHAACAGGEAGLDEIVFADGVTGTILLDEGQMELTESLNITGPGADLLTIDAQSLSRIFYMNTSETNTTRLAGLTLTGGRTAATGFLGNGGAVLSLGALELVDAVVTGNSTALEDSPGGALFAGVHLSLLRSSVTGNWTEGEGSPGGGVTVPIGVVTVVDSTISDNWTEGGFSGAGGLLMLIGFNDATIINSTISGNATYGEQSQAGGLAIGGGLTIVNSTISGNSANGPEGDGGAIAVTGFLTIVNSSLVGNSAVTGASAIRFANTDSPFTVSNSIIASSDASLPLCPRAIDAGDSTGNLATDASCGNVSLVNGAPVGFNELALGELADNGGPTRTHALLAGSAAIDTADADICGSDPVNHLDQRGSLRPVDGDADGDATCDVGAYEADNPDVIFMGGFEAM
jgi:hypothetical protein